MTREACFPVNPFFEVSRTLIFKTVCESGGSFLHEVMKQLALFLPQIFHIYSSECQLNFTPRFIWPIFFFWNRDLKSTEFLKSTPETSNQKFDQYWPTVWRGVVGIDAHGIIAYTLSSQSSESREDNECDISNRILLRTARGFIQQELQICLAVLMLHLLDNKNSKQLSGRKEICICQKTLLFTGSSASLCFLMCCLKQKKKLFKSEGHARYHLPLLQPPWSNSDNRTHPYKRKWG